MKKLLVFFLFILLLLFLINNSPLMSVVTIKNGTNKIVYVFSGESIYGVEPEPDEVDRIKRKVPEVVGPGETIKSRPHYPP
ncbi:hypothetical protein [Pluralibacter gergoviae]|uniref:hypothetical protein n=1 Tax=Pluralibacter gergoviae TaxID=61647 RepID=UPI0012D45FCA|nr:hypothetical protein [Pluralibacter gergoviae]